jgi:hypothetical protein
MRLMAAVVTVGLAMGSVAWGQVPVVQTDITVPPGATLLRTVEGRGFQVYGCAGSGEAFQWTLLRPEAVLIDLGSGEQMGTHGEGPVWTWKDGSSVKGVVEQKLASPEAGAVPWLLLKTTPVEPGGSGAMARVSWVRRSATHGGAAPAEGCDAAHEGATTRIPYKALYSFYSE